MNIQEMHTTFRTLGQQMGMQLIRGILPESIDVFINEAINEKVRSVVIMNTTTQFRDRVAIQDNSISPINSIRTLVKKGSITINSSLTDTDYYTADVAIDNVMFYTSFGVRYIGNVKKVGARFIESDKLDDTRSDYCNSESWDYPIITMYSNDQDKEYIQLYINNNIKKPATVEVDYIILPKIVKWNATLATAVSCNLPVYTHNEIVELAVNKFFNSVNSTTKQPTRN